MMEKYYWGKFYMGSGKIPRKIWIGPLTEEEMKQDFEEFRHNQSHAVKSLTCPGDE
jgi:hypothetical protein